MKQIVRSLLETGMSSSTDELQNARTYLLNWFALVSVIICVLLVIVNVILATYHTVLITTGGVLLFLLTFYLNSRKLYKTAGVYYVTFSYFIIAVAAFNAFSKGRFTDTENLMIAAILLSIFLFDNWVLIIDGLIGVIVFVGLKVYKNNIQQIPDENNLTFTLINVSVLVLGLCAFSILFKRLLLKSLQDARLQKDILYQLIDHIPVYIGIFNNQGRYVMVNRKYEETFRKKREDIIGKRLRDIIAPHNVEKYEPLLERALNGEEVDFHIETLMQNGDTIYANGKYKPVFDEEGKIKFVTVALYDVAKLEKIKQELEAANQAKDKLFNIVAHDVRNPLSNFEILLNSSQDDFVSQDAFKGFLGQIRTKFEPLKKTIDDLLEWSFHQLDGMVAKPENVPLKGIIEEVLEAQKPHFEKKNIDYGISGSLEESFVDKGHLRIILRNIVHNALKFTPEKGKVQITLASEGDQVYISIADSGKGLTEKQMEGIMKKKVADSQPGTSGEKGSGIGLSFSVELIEKNHGSLEISNTHEGGAVFKILLPKNISS